MTNAEFLDHIEHRIKNNSGQPAMFTAAEVNRLRELAGPKYNRFKQTTDTILGSTGRSLIRVARNRIVAAVLRKLGPPPTQLVVPTVNPIHATRPPASRSKYAAGAVNDFPKIWIHF